MPSIENDQLRAIGGGIAAVRRMRGMTQQQLADAIGLTRTSVANIEAGRQDTGISTLLAIASALGIGADLLLGEGATAKGAAVAAQLYVGAALDEAEQHIRREVDVAFANARATYLKDLEGEEPFGHLARLAQRLRGGEQPADIASSPTTSKEK